MLFRSLCSIPWLSRQVQNFQPWQNEVNEPIAPMQPIAAEAQAIAAVAPIAIPEATFPSGEAPDSTETNESNAD